MPDAKSKKFESSIVKYFSEDKEKNLNEFLSEKKINEFLNIIIIKSLDFCKKDENFKTT
jgi:hypothetical protein